jgi:hypothetical protein
VICDALGQRSPEHRVFGGKAIVGIAGFDDKGGVGLGFDPDCFVRTFDTVNRNAVTSYAPD